MSSNNIPNHPNTESLSAWARLRPRDIQQMTERQLVHFYHFVSDEEVSHHQENLRGMAFERLNSAPHPLSMPEARSSTPEPVDLSPLPIEDSQTDDVSTPHASAGTKFMEQLPDISLKDFSNETDCHICMEAFDSAEEPESPVQLPCGHILGRKCISKWLNTSNSCPLCRHVLFKQETQHPPFQIFQTVDGRPFRHFREPFDIGAVLRRAGLSEQEAASFQEDWSDITWQQASLEMRLVGLETAHRPMPPRIVAELEALVEEARELAARLEGFWVRYREVVDGHRVGLPEVESFDLEGALAFLGN